MCPEKENQLFQLELASKSLLDGDDVKFWSLFSAHISLKFDQNVFTKNYRKNISFFLSSFSDFEYDSQDTTVDWGRKWLVEIWMGNCSDPALHEYVL